MSLTITRLLLPSLAIALILALNANPTRHTAPSASAANSRINNAGKQLPPDAAPSEQQVYLVPANIIS